MSSITHWELAPGWPQWLSMKTKGSASPGPVLTLHSFETCCRIGEDQSWCTGQYKAGGGQRWPSGCFWATACRVPSHWQWQLVLKTTREAQSPIFVWRVVVPQLPPLHASPGKSWLGCLQETSILSNWLICWQVPYCYTKADIENQLDPIFPHHKPQFSFAVVWLWKYYFTDCLCTLPFIITNLTEILVH